MNLAIPQTRLFRLALKWPKAEQLVFWLTLIGLAVSFFPVLSWYGARLMDRGGEALGLIPLVLMLALRDKERQEPSQRLALVALVCYAASFHFLPPLIRTFLAFVTIAFLVGIHRQPGMMGLLILSLPIQASLDFFLGFPLRFLTAEISSVLLSLTGFPITRVGVQLAHGDLIVAVDPPCSGLQMLWATGFITAMLSACFRLPWWRTIALSLLALVLCLFGNSLRAALLFFPESGMVSWPGVAHVGIGAVIFLGAAVLLVVVARRLSSRKPEAVESGEFRFRKVFVLAVLATVATTFYAPAVAIPRQDVFPKLTQYRGQNVEELTLSPFEEQFARTFPGQMNLYRVGNQTLIVRHVTRATRRLHPSSHCLQGDGFQLGPKTVMKEHGGIWLKYEASRFQERLLVTERISAIDHAGEWTEVSSWYWHAFLNPNTGPWRAETLITPITSSQ